VLELGLNRRLGRNMPLNNPNFIWLEPTPVAAVFVFSIVTKSNQKSKFLMISFSLPYDLAIVSGF